MRDSTLKRTRQRMNARAFDGALIDVRKVQRGRQVSEDWVISTNHILKMRARKYVAAVNRDWLFPERQLAERRWNRLGGKFFLMPDPRKAAFSSGIIVGMGDVSAWGRDEYGHHGAQQGAMSPEQRREFDAFQREKRRWDQKFGELSREERQPYW